MTYFIARNELIYTEIGLLHLHEIIQFKLISIPAAKVLFSFANSTPGNWFNANKFN
jgi:hypothetical protein